MDLIEEGAGAAGAGGAARGDESGRLMTLLVNSRRSAFGVKGGAGVYMTTEGTKRKFMVDTALSAR